MARGVSTFASSSGSPENSMVKLVLPKVTYTAFDFESILYIVQRKHVFYDCFL